MKVYPDNNIIVSIEQEQYSLEFIQRLFNGNKIDLFYSSAHIFEATNLRDQGNIKKEIFLAKRFETIRRICLNKYFYRDYISKTDQQITRDPSDAYNDISNSPIGIASINMFVNLITEEQKKRIRSQLGIESSKLNNFKHSEIIEHLNTKLTIWENKYSFFEIIERAISQFPNGNEFGIYHRFAAIFTFLDVLGYWKDKTSDQSNNARLWDSMHAYFATHCDYFLSDDRNARQKSRVLYDLYKIETKVVSSKGALED